MVTMREQTYHILTSYYKQKYQGGDEESKKRDIIETAPRLIKSDIKSHVSTVTNQYPSCEDLKLDSVHRSFRLVCGQHWKHCSLGKTQDVIRAVRPRAVIAPLQIGPAVQIHHLYRSKVIVDTLHEMGFCCSYTEVIRFEEKNAADCVQPDVLGDDIDLLEMSVLFSADDVDHGDKSDILSTLDFVYNIAIKHNLPIIITCYIACL